MMQHFADSPKRPSETVVRVDGDGRDDDFDTPNFTVTIDTTVTLLV
jgi:hypothetical protein